MKSKKTPPAGAPQPRPRSIPIQCTHCTMSFPTDEEYAQHLRLVNSTNTGIVQDGMASSDGGIDGALED